MCVCTREIHKVASYDRIQFFVFSCGLKLPICQYTSPVRPHTHTHTHSSLESRQLSTSQTKSDAIDYFISRNHTLLAKQRKRTIDTTFITVSDQKTKKDTRTEFQVKAHTHTHTHGSRFESLELFDRIPLKKNIYICMARGYRKINALYSNDNNNNIR